MVRIPVLVVVGALLGSQAFAGGVDERVAASRATVQAFSKALGGELKKAMAAGGPKSAVQVCNVMAPAVADDFSRREGWTVGRTSLRLRNPSNAPDDWERGVLEAFEARTAAGEDPAKMEFYEFVTGPGKRTFRYMKAIPTAPMCLVCHGDALDPELGAQLTRLYPDDRARGFRAGDIRGAFTITQPD